MKNNFHVLHFLNVSHYKMEKKYFLTNANLPSKTEVWAHRPWPLAPMVNSTILATSNEAATYYALINNT